MPVFNEAALKYDKWYEEKKGEFIDGVESELAFGMLKIKKGMKILDVGCGTGNYSIKLAERGCRVTGIDISEKMLEIAREKANWRNLAVDFVNMDVKDLKFADDTFDAAISMAAFEFIDDIAQVTDEIFRTVKKGGQVLIGTINGDSDWGRFYKSKEISENSVFRYAHFKTLDDLKRLKPKSLLETGECLFVSPYAGEDEFNFDVENKNKRAGQKKGGFICALWEK